MNKTIIVFIFLSVSLFSKEISLNLDKAIKLALENNSLNKISKLNLQVAQAQYEQALSANYPSLNALVYANRDNKDTIFQQRGNFTLSQEMTKTLSLANTLGMSDTAAQAIGFPDVATYQSYLNSLDASNFPEGTISADLDVVAKGRDTVLGQIEVNYPIYTGGKISAIIEQARLNKEIQKQSLIRDKTSVVYDVKRYFYGYILTNELYSLVNSIYKNFVFSRDLTKEFLENGSDLKIKKTDYLNIKLLTALTQSTLATIELNRAMLKGALANSVGLKYNDAIKINYDKQQILRDNRDLQELVKKASSLNPDVNSIDIALKIKNEQIKEANSGHLPIVNLFGNVSHTYNSYEYGYLSEDDANRWSIGVAIQIPIFDGYKTTNSVIEKRLDKRIIEEQKLQLEEGLALQLKNEFLKSSIGFKQIEVLKEAVETARENSKMNFKGYQYEMVEAEDLVQSQLMEVYVKSNYLKNVHDYLISLATIDKLVGEKIDDDF